MILVNKKLKLWLICMLMVFNVIPAAAADRPTDKEITRWVEEALKMDYRLNNSNLKVTTDAGIVSLSGEVTTLVAKKYADLEARKISGVLGVVNKINVLASHRSDTDIQRDLRRRYMDSLDPELQNIAVQAADGRVTLSGQVDSASQRRRAGLVAAELQGVKAVDNHLEIAVKQPRSDQEIRKDILNTLGSDVYFADVYIDVDVHNEIVTLTGKVDTAYQKERAAEDCLLVANVKTVKNYLEIGKEHDTGIRTKAPVPTDVQLANNVRDELLQDLRVINPFRVEVKAKDGHVVLRGVLASRYQQLLAVQDAHEVVGVIGVTDLTSVGTERRDDKTLHENIRFALDTDSALSKFKIGIGVKDGIVILSGDVQTAYEKAHAAAIASRVKGVRKAINRIKVNPISSYSDATLKKQIESRLAHNGQTHGIANQIDLQVRDGVVTLSGKVDTWAERTEAATVATLTDGVRSVVNRLRIKGVNYYQPGEYDDFPKPIQSLLRSLNQPYLGSQAFFQPRINLSQIYFHSCKVCIFIKLAAPDECLCIYNDRCKFGAFQIGSPKIGTA
jgi:osmotically-inducible protein OsmY